MEETELFHLSPFTLHLFTLTRPVKLASFRAPGSGLLPCLSFIRRRSGLCQIESGKGR